MKYSKLASINLPGATLLRSGIRPTEIMARAPLLLLLFTACGFPRPADVGDDAPGDSSIPGITLHVSLSGDDANDGLTQPVKTLKHAIGLAAADTRITNIILASGTYSTSSGETFPYTVPPNVTIAGPAGGGAILAGSKMEPGVTVEAGRLQDLDLQNFTVAITATGTASLKNIRVLTSAIAVQAETAARLSADNLEIAGAAGACAMGIVLNGAAALMVATLATRNLGTTLDARDQSAINIASANISGDTSCSQSIGLMLITSTASFVLRDSLLDGGSNHGILINPKSTSFQATISNTIVRNMKRDALGGGAPAGNVASFQITGGELSSNGGGGAELSTGIWTFTNVTIRQNVTIGIYLQDGRLIMRGCTITGNPTGIDVFDNASADLGTVASPGNNLFQDNTTVGLAVDGNFGATRVDAIGNLWKPNVQGADATGRYATPSTISGPVATVNGNNYAIGNGWSLSR